jgi:hypothetical protein
MTLRTELKKAIDWIVFVWRMLGQIGGPWAIAKALGKALLIPLRRAGR